MSNFYAVIMAGGYGERFWPLSTKDKPKQFINLINDQSLIEMTVERISPIFSNSNIVIITNNEHLELTKKTFPNIPEENIIGEPLLRDTGAAITTSLAFIKNLNPNATFCVLASDHFIDDKKNFNNTILNSMSLAAEDDILITIGIKPTFPSTGYGYIKKETLYKTVKDLKFYITKRFVEKPKIENAKYYVSDKDYYWNSGIFIWSVNSLEKALEQSTCLFNYYNKLLPYVEKGQINEGLKELYPDLEKISIDYALMEKV
ncbi:MAG: mannose-1-phosphate guanylyltransferase, partial [Verrucomicrobiota bacterium]|nr:mannose-1-phosphate guanylyltransferase [Verrucomicrobiota bacterium]